MLSDVGVIQIDSVNVLVRSHELPLFARLGPHPRDMLPRLHRRREVFEYWGHEASWLPVSLHPLLRWRMDAFGSREGGWVSLVRIAQQDPEFVEGIYDEVRDRGPLTASALTEPGGRTGPWWGWNRGKQALECLFWCGRITSSERRPNFERVYDLTERVIPAAILAEPTPVPAQAQRALLLAAAKCLGVGTAEDIADYFRLKMPVARPLLAELVEEGQLTAARVDGWKKPAFLHPAAQLPSVVRAETLLSPFDSLVWERDRTERLFGFRYRLELYTPAAKRQFGYYVLPFLLGDQLVARVDLKAARREGQLQVNSAYLEPGHASALVVAALARQVKALAEWLGFEQIVVTPNGDLGPALAAALR